MIEQLLIVLFLMFRTEVLANEVCTFEKGCFTLHLVEETWQDAWLFCNEDGGNLAVIDSQSTLDIITSQLDLSGVEFWIGVTDSVIPGVYYTTKGHVLSWAKWAPYEPDNNHFIEHCVTYFDAEGGYFDRFCEDHYPFLCHDEVSAECNGPTCAPWVNIEFNMRPQWSCSDHNQFIAEGNSKCVEMCQRATHFICSSVENSLQTCRGSTLNWEDINKGTCLKADVTTDLHTRVYNPPYEPMIAYDYVTVNSSRGTDLGTWDEAIRACEDAGYSLLTIKSPEQDKAVGQLETWLALKNEGPPSWSYKWHEGNYVLYHHWGGNTANTDREKRCVYRTSSGEWHDRYCDDVLSFVCQVEDTDGVIVKPQIGTSAPEATTSQTTPSLEQTTTVEEGEYGVADALTVECKCFGKVSAIIGMLGLFSFIDCVLLIHIYRIRYLQRVKSSTSTAEDKLMSPHAPQVCVKPTKVTSPIATPNAEKVEHEDFPPQTCV